MVLGGASEQRVSDDGVIVSTGILATVTEKVAVEEQPDVVPVTVYVVFPPGVAEILAPVVALRPVAGVHAYVVAPEAVVEAGPPEHELAKDGVHTTVGVVLTVTDEVVRVVLVHPVPG